MQVAVYARVSTQRQAQSQTAGQQLERFFAHAQTQGWVLEPELVFRDDGYSGASLRRPGLDRLRDAVANARLDRILITAPNGWPATSFTRCYSWRSCRNTVPRWCSLTGR
jgi:site-specific DNA recombinase